MYCVNPHREIIDRGRLHSKHKQHLFMSENIQVVVRCRARNKRETAANSPPVVELPNDVFSAEEPFVAISNLQQPLTSVPARSSLSGGKVFKVDQVYGPNADQRLLFDNVALPLFDDFVSGLNVTILAYGQTGSGKTYTMCGDLEGEHAGIIPRILSRLFTVLDGDYMVKLSCVELYKEELHDLVNDELELMPPKSKLRLVNESGPGQSGSTVIHNLAQVHIDNSEMGFNILKKCLTKRKTSATKLNDLSSRSHTIFTINLYREVKNAAGFSEYRLSKMNLVDLAGSEDINKSGAVNERAREAGSINQSLLTLGKVINSLSEGKEPRHIPYRESKLTRLLQGSIGGKTKTALIATVSPAKINAQETISTLNYASKAKNIRNLPQSTFDSDMVLKKVLVQELSGQISRITRDLLANRDKENGIKMSYQNYEQLNRNADHLQVDLKEKNSELSGLRLKIERKDAEIAELREKLLQLEKDSQGMKESLKNSENNFAFLSTNYSTLQRDYNIQNDKVSRLLRGNVHGLSTALSEVVALVHSGTEAISTNFQNLEVEVKSEFSKLLSTLTEKINDIGVLLDSQSSAVDVILKRDLDVSPFIEQANRLISGTPLLELSTVNRDAFGQLELRLNPDSDLNQKVLESAKRVVRENSETFKAQMMKHISTTVDRLFQNELPFLERPVEFATSAALRSSKNAVTEEKQRTSVKMASVLSKAEAESKAVKTELDRLHHSFNKALDKTSLEISNNYKMHVSGAIHDAERSITKSAKTGIEETKKSVAAVRDVVVDMGTTTSVKVEQASRDLNGFVGIISGLENSAGGIPQPSPLKNDITLPKVTHSPVNLPGKAKSTTNEVTSTMNETPTKPLARSLLSVQNSCAPSGIKRRKPSSPLKENGLHRSRIPQLFPN